MEAELSDVPGVGGRPKRGAGRPPKPLEGSKSALAALGAQLRTLRNRRSLTLHKLSELTGYSPQHLGAVERGQVVPSEAMVGACDIVLLANGQLITMLAGVIREQARLRNINQTARRGNRPGLERAARLQVTSYELHTEIDWERLADVGRRPSRVTPAMVEDLEQITSRQRRLYHDLSSAEMLTQVQTHLGLLTALLDGHQSGLMRHRIASAAAEAAGLAAWLWFDLGDTGKARQYYDQATEAVREAGDYGLGAYVKGYQGMVAAQVGRPAAALAYLSGATDTAPRSVSGVTRAWLTIQAAEAMAHTGRSTDAVRAIYHAHELLTNPGPQGNDPWMYEFDEGSLAAHTGNCHLALEQPKQAAEEFESALRLRPPSCDRRGARIKVGLARARLAQGDGDDALGLATEALDVFTRRGSAAGVLTVSNLRGAFVTAGMPSAADALDEHARCMQDEDR